MKLFFLRHGIAEDGRPGTRDFDRRLTDEGVAQMRGVARGLRALDLEPEVILTSPVVRARQTAEIAAEELSAAGRLQVEQRLACGCRFQDLAQMVDGHGPKARILLVGHEPDLSAMVRSLSGGCVHMGKASLACVECADVATGSGELRWLLKAEHLCLIGES